jgi:hypothetical protein
VHGEEFSEIRARFRTGRRATLVVTPREGALTPATRPPGDAGDGVASDDAAEP